MTKSIEDWVEEDLRTSKEEEINMERDRIEKVLENRDGALHPIKSKLSTPEHILTFMLSAAVENLANIRDTDNVENSELYEIIDDEKKTIRARLSRLRNRNLIEKSGKGKHRIIYSNLEEILDYLVKGND